jgi:uncharacterized protein YbjT (DUF2867 family)
MKVLILGATGLVGQNTLVQAVTHPAITQIIAPTRTPLPPSSNLANPVAERLELLLPEVLTWGVNAVICALGTTSGKAGSKEAFRQVDYVLPLAFARLAHQQGAETFALVSAIGADAKSSFFYPKTKGEVERDMKLVGFKSLTILRPSIIGGKRDESRFAEGLALTLSRILAPVLPKKFHVRSEDRRRSSRQCHWSDPRLSLSLRRKFDLIAWRDVHEIAFDADKDDVNRNSHHNKRKI